METSKIIFDRYILSYLYNIIWALQEQRSNNIISTSFCKTKRVVARWKMVDAYIMRDYARYVQRIKIIYLELGQRS